MDEFNVEGNIIAQLPVRCFSFFAARAAYKAASETAYLSHLPSVVIVAVVIIGVDRGGTPLGHQCSIYRPLAWAIGEHGYPYTSSNMAALIVLSALPCGKCWNYGFLLTGVASTLISALVLFLSPRDRLSASWSLVCRVFGVVGAW